MRSTETAAILLQRPLVQNREHKPSNIHLNTYYALWESRSQEQSAGKKINTFLEKYLINKTTI